MSIIQEALKKAQAKVKVPATSSAPPQDDGGRFAAPVRNTEEGRSKFTAGARSGRDISKPAASRQDPKAVAVLLVILIAAAFFAASRLFPNKNIAAGGAVTKSGKAGESSAVETAKSSAITAGANPVKAEDFPTLQSIVFQRPEEKKEERRAYQTEFVLNGIMYLEDSPRAIINDAMVGVGDAVSGARVSKIEKRYVVLQYNGAEIVLDLK